MAVFYTAQGRKSRRKTMGKLPSDAVCSNMIGFLLSWHAAREGWELTGARGVSREELGLKEGEDRMNDILSVEYVSGLWRIEIRLPGGGRAVVSDPGSFQDAMAKARRAQPEEEPA